MIPARVHEQDPVESHDCGGDTSYELEPLEKSRQADYLDIISRCHDIGIVDCDLLDNGTRHPNLALMKLAGYCLDIGCNVELIEDYSTTYDYDVVFASKVFSFSSVPDDFLTRENVFVGGTGFYPKDGHDLPYEIEHHMPYYDLYKNYVESHISSGRTRSWFSDYLDYSIGFLSRGCFRKCSFCVNQKYDHAFLHSPLSEFLDPDRPRIYLWDDNFLACSGWEKALDELEACGKPFQFRQGLDIRLLNEKRARRLSKVNYCGDFIFAFDHIEDRKLIEEKLRLWRKFTTRGTRLYVLCAFDSQDEQDIVNTFERIKILMHYGCLPYIMRYESYKQSKWRSLYVSIARWCNQPQFFKKKSFRDFCETNQLYHRNKSTFCAALQSMTDFEAAFPDIAAQYFDLRYEEENLLYRYGRPYFASPTDEASCIQMSSWTSLGEGLGDEECLELYYEKKLDIVWVEENVPDRSSDLCDRLFSVLLRSSVQEAFAAVLAGSNDEFVTPDNIPQFSSLQDVDKIADILSQAEDFVDYSDLGVYLQPNGFRKDGANKKYGENHGKLASLMDLATIEKKSRFGCRRTEFSSRFSACDPSDKSRLFALLAMRIPVIQQILRAADKGTVSVIEHLVVLSESTQKRRLPNIIALLNVIKDQASPDSSLFAAILRVER